MNTRPAPKPTPRAKSAPIRNSAAGQPCTLRLYGCEPGNETVVLAHLRGPWSLGRVKPHDFFAVYACRNCHSLEEQGASDWCSNGDRLRALYETQSALLDAGLISVKGAP